jgi:hypothetical protein
MSRTKLFFDFEFTGLHQKTTPISLGIMSEQGHSFYAEFSDYDSGQLNQWIIDNVMPHLSEKAKIKSGSFETVEVSDKSFVVYGDKIRIANCLNGWIQQFESVEMWGDCLAYDWVLFCNLFGGALNVPPNVYYIPFDLCTLFLQNDIDPNVDRIEWVKKQSSFGSNLEGKKHNALFDASIIAQCVTTILQIKDRVDHYQNEIRKMMDVIVYNGENYAVFGGFISMRIKDGNKPTATVSRAAQNQCVKEILPEG